MDDAEDTVEVTVTGHDAETAEIRVVGELTEGARRPLVRAMTDLMLGSPELKRVQLDTREVTFMNSAGIASLVQLHKMVQPRGIELPLVVHSTAVARPLQLSGLWHRFTVIDRRDDSPDVVHESTHRRTEHS
ncbi:STAS domain-containing protein [Modestobacter sp. L9-4]|uniref:STAS domain-containing protein n=1 Tax=Modestobacter sp. L9-4 TaxID=2851567 RepID=UPI001C7508B5|nr:STAS domain-containing protein [Modestobacter sp. L9-4]QXG74437.1 STAS domain-containing protein [Modestobacter sp. L9-4]